MRLSLKTIFKTNHYRGLMAEMIARLFLRCKGYRILEIRYRTPFGEIDLIARKRNTLIAVEIKLRKTQTAAAESINKHQQERIIKSFHAYSAKISWQPQEYRFDVILITPWSLPIHLKNAWQIQN